LPLILAVIWAVLWLINVDPNRSDYVAIHFSVNIDSHVTLL